MYIEKVDVDLFKYKFLYSNRNLVSEDWKRLIVEMKFDV